jgi:hypothetical protein
MPSGITLRSAQTLVIGRGAIGTRPTLLRWRNSCIIAMFPDNRPTGGSQRQTCAHQRLPPGIETAVTVVGQAWRKRMYIASKHETDTGEVGP